MIKILSIFIFLMSCAKQEAVFDYDAHKQKVDSSKSRFDKLYKELDKETK